MSSPVWQRQSSQDKVVPGWILGGGPEPKKTIRELLCACAFQCTTKQKAVNRNLMEAVTDVLLTVFAIFPNQNVSKRLRATLFR